MEARENLDTKPYDIDQFELIVLESVRNGLYRYYRPEGSEKGEMPFHNLQHALNTEA